MSGAGSVLDPAGIPISTAANGQLTRRWPGTAPTSSWCGRTGRSGQRRRHLRGPGERRGQRARPRRHPHSTGGQDTVAGGGLERHQLPGGVAGHSALLRDIYGARVSSAGSVLDARAASPSPPRPTTRSRRRWPRGATTSWWCGRTAARAPTTTSTGPEWARDGTVAQPAGIPISTAAGNQTAPDLAVRYDFLVAWRDRRSGTNYDIYATA